MSRYTVRHSVNGRAGGRTGATGALAVLTDEHSGGWEPRTWLGAPAPGGLALPQASPSMAWMYSPRGVFIDDSHVVVADSGNHRVLIWHGVPESDEQPADVVLGQEADSRILALSLYGSAKTEDGFVVDGQLSLTDIDIDTTRTVAFLGGSQTLTSESSNSGFAAAVGISYDFEGPLGTISPGIELRYVDHSFDPVSETGGSLALTINRENVESLQGRIGLDYQSAGGPIQMDANIDFVHEYEDGPSVFTAQFASGTGPAVPFLLADQTKDWGEAGFSLQYVSGGAQFGVGFDTTIGRDNADAQTYRATATFKF